MFNINNYFNTSSNLIKSLGKHENDINKIVEKILENHKKRNKILVAGNGGSCADAEHFAGELQCTYKNSNREAISAISIGSMTASITAWSNDFGFDTYFERQVKAHGKKNDILFCISTGGGNTQNGASMSLVKAAIEAKKKDMVLVSLVGKSGGELKKISDICIHIDNKITAFIQESHMSILHCICEILDEKLV